MNEATVSCDTTQLKNGSILYWQYNCDRIWLTLQNVKREKIVIDEVPVEFYGYTYRLGFHLIKEFRNSLLFRTGCGASGPCFYILIDKYTGKKLKEFDQLICIDTDVQLDDAQPYNYNFVAYLSENLDQLIVYFIDSQETIKAPFREKLTSAIPQRQFEKMIVENTHSHFITEPKAQKKRNSVFVLTLRGKAPLFNIPSNLLSLPQKIRNFYLCSQICTHAFFPAKPCFLHLVFPVALVHLVGTGCCDG